MYRNILDGHSAPFLFNSTYAGENLQKDVTFMHVYAEIFVDVS